MTVPLQLAEALRRVLESERSELHTAIPGIVRGYDHEKQTADVEPALLRVVPAFEEEDEDPRERLPILPSVPVQWPRAGGFFLHFPVEAGDECLLVFSESDINAWRESGQVSDPGTFARHVLSGAVAIPGIHSRGKANTSASSTDGRIGKEGGPFIGFTPGGEIQVGGPYELCRGDNLQEHLDAISTALDAIYNTLSGGTSPDYGVAARASKELSFPTQTTIAKGQ